MSDNDKNMNRHEDDDIAELMNAFGGYEQADVPEDITIEIPEDEAYEDDPVIVLPEIPEEEPATEVTGEITAEESAVEETVLKEPVADEPESEPEPAKHRKEKKAKKKKEKTEKTEKSDKPEKKEKKQEPAKEKTEESEQEDEQKPVSPVRLVVVLTVICAAVALLLATVNHFTVSKIAENNEKAMLDSIREIFDGTVQAESVALPEESELAAAYLVIKDGGVCGYAASVAPTGFGGPMSLMVGVDSDGATVGVEIVSMSETPGLGSRVGGEEFLSRFTGISGNAEVDAISGATISSKAVIAGVNSALSSSLDLTALASERGMSVVPFDKSAPVTETEAPETATPVTVAPETESPVTVAPVTEAAPPDVTKGDTPPQNINENPNKVDEGIHAEYKEDTAEYETLTTEPETSVTEETE